MLAVQLANYWSDYDDIAFDVSLKAVTYHPVLPKATLQIGGGTRPTISVETPAGAVCQLQSSDAGGQGGWQLMQAFTNSSGGLKTFEDTGQNGRLPPRSVAARYYRIIPF